MVQIAVDHVDFARVGDDAYRAFVAGYGGRDITATVNFRGMADIQELRWLGFVLSKVRTRQGAAAEARHRVACLRGRVDRPWTWAAF